MTQAEQIYRKHFHGPKSMWLNNKTMSIAAIQEALDSRDEYWAIENLGTNARITELEKELQDLREAHKKGFVMGYNEAATKYDSTCSFGELEAEQYYNQVFKTFTNEQQ